MTNKQARTPKIIAILNENEVVINQGAKDGVKEHDKFDILDNEPSKLIDPDTKEVLDEYRQKKSQVVVKVVKPKYCICVGTYTVTSNPIAKSLLEPIMPMMHIREEPMGQKINIDPSEAKDIFSEFNHKTIHLGDKVIKAD